MNTADPVEEAAAFAAAAADPAFAERWLLDLPDVADTGQEDIIMASDEIRSIEITPDWEQLAAFTATNLANHGFDRGAVAPVTSLIETVAYLAQTDPEAVRRLIERLERAA